MKNIKEYHIFKEPSNLSEEEEIKTRIQNDLREYYPLSNETLELIDNFSNELIKSLKK